MTDRVIQLVPEQTRHIPLDLSAPAHLDREPLDQLRRPLRDLRISVTDRCNFRCVYCMPKSIFDKNYQFLAQTELLNFEEIEQVAKVFVGLGVEKLRLTGGEPLLRKNLEILIEKLSSLKTPTGEAVEIALTTNGTLLRKKARTLKEAGLNRVTVSLDAIEEQTFRAMNDVDFSVADVLDGIAAAEEAGLGPIKVNMVVKGGMNDDQIIPMARHFKNSPHVLRFIEYMDVGSTNGWKMDEVIPSARVINLIQEHVGPLTPADPNYKGEVAQRWHYLDGVGEIGVISSVTQAFCSDCSRIRLSTDGKLYTCLFATRGHDIKPLIRSGQDAEHIENQLSNAVHNLWNKRQDRYSEIRTSHTIQPSDRIEMHYIGG